MIKQSVQENKTISIGNIIIEANDIENAIHNIMYGILIFLYTLSSILFIHTVNNIFTKLKDSISINL